MTRFCLLHSIRAAMAAALSVTIAVSQSAVNRQSAIAPVWADRNAVIRPYFPVDVPPVRTTNSQRLAALVRGGALYLTAQDAIALALENNIDLEVSRYGPITAGWRLTRSEAGGALPGVPSAASQTGAVAAGQGVQGSQAAAGVSVPGGGGNTNNTANATISQIGPVTQNLDPIIQESSTFSHTSNPQPNAVQSVTNNLVSNTRAHNGVLQQGLLSGGLVSIRYTQNWLEENSPTNILNPSTAGNLSINAQHNLLRGFGIAVNARNITIARRNIGISDLNFRGQVIATVAQVLSAYNGLAASYEDARSRRNAADVAQQFLKNVRFQVEAGSVAPPEAFNAEALSVTSNQQLVDAEATLQQRETQLKNLISRTGTSDPLLTSTRIVPIDRITIPEREDLPPVEELVKLAIANRTDLLNQQASFETSEINSLGTRNGLLPSLTAFAAAQNAGLAGTPRFVTRAPGQPPQGPDPFFIGNVDNVLGQVFRRNFPTQRAGVFLSATLKNRQAQADYAIDQLQLRQNELSNRKNTSEVQVAVLNYLVQVQQARARHEATVRNRVLQQQLFEAEQKKFQLGASIPYNVITQQRDLVNAQAAELNARITYSNARTGLDQTTGRTLEANNVSLTEARDGRVSRVSTPSEAPSEAPAPQPQVPQP